MQNKLCRSSAIFVSHSTVGSFNKNHKLIQPEKLVNTIVKIVIKRFKRLYGYIYKLIVSPLMTNLLKKRIRLKYLFYYTCITTRAISFSSAVVCRFFFIILIRFQIEFFYKNFSRDRTKVGQTNIFRVGWPKLAKIFSKVGQSLTFHLASGVPTFIWASSSRMVIMVTPTFVLIQYTTIIPSVDRNTTMYLLGMYGQEQQPLELASDMSDSSPLTLSSRGSPSLVCP